MGRKRAHDEENGDVLPLSKKRVKLEIHSDSLNEDIDRINGEDDVHIANKPKTFTKKEGNSV